MTPYEYIKGLTVDTVWKLCDFEHIVSHNVMAVRALGESTPSLADGGYHEKIDVKMKAPGRQTAMIDVPTYYPSASGGEYVQGINEECVLELTSSSLDYDSDENTTDLYMSFYMFGR